MLRIDRYVYTYCNMVHIQENGAHINVAATDGVENDIDDGSTVVFPRNQEP